MMVRYDEVQLENSIRDYVKREHLITTLQSSHNINNWGFIAACLRHGPISVSAIYHYNRLNNSGNCGGKKGKDIDINYIYLQFHSFSHP